MNRDLDASDSKAWRAMAREVLRAFDLDMTPPCGMGAEQRSKAMAAHIERGRELLDEIIDQHVAAARTAVGRASRRRRAQRGIYAAAFDEAAAYARAVRDGQDRVLPAPALFSRGRLPLLDRHTHDRTVLSEGAR
ncbi:hypothetical protein ABT093_30495 [Kitasatospora sp. NPDC002551]|uniref:hypothetical protein n=1 Tax=Kitasatospora sp. NPDC002551 TaxID=3154539 RepID=UPI003329923A